MSFRRKRSGKSDPSAESDPSAGATPSRQSSRPPAEEGGGMLPRRQGRRFAVERILVRLVATGGIIGVGVLLGAILGSNKVQGWITGLVVAVVTVVLAALLWSSRQL